MQLKEREEKVFGINIEGIELLVSGFIEDSKIFENCDTFSHPVFTSCEIHGVVPSSSQPLTFMEISFITLRLLVIMGSKSIMPRSNNLMMD